MAFQPTDYPDVLVPVSGTNRYIRRITCGGNTLWIKKWNLTVNAGTGGSITGGASGKVVDGSSLSLTATPSSGYKFDRWEFSKSLPQKYKNNDSSATEKSTITPNGNKLNLTVKENVGVNAIFVEDTCSLTITLGNPYTIEPVDTQESDIDIHDYPAIGIGIFNEVTQQVEWTDITSRGQYLENLDNDQSVSAYAPKECFTGKRSLTISGIPVGSYVNIRARNFIPRKHSIWRDRDRIPGCYEFIGWTNQNIIFGQPDFDSVEFDSPTINTGAKISSGTNNYMLLDADTDVLFNTPGGNDFVDNPRNHITTVYMNRNKHIYGWFAHVRSAFGAGGLRRWAPTPDSVTDGALMYDNLTDQKATEMVDAILAVYPTVEYVGTYTGANKITGYRSSDIELPTGGIIAHSSDETYYFYKESGNRRYINYNWRLGYNNVISNSMNGFSGVDCIIKHLKFAKKPGSKTDKTMLHEIHLRRVSGGISQILKNKLSAIYTRL